MQDDNGQRSLHRAAAGGHFKAVNRLLDRGVVVNGFARTIHGQRAVQAASAAGRLNAISPLLKRGAGVNLWPRPDSDVWIGIVIGHFHAVFIGRQYTSGIICR